MGNSREEVTTNLIHKIEDSINVKLVEWMKHNLEGLNVESFNDCITINEKLLVKLNEMKNEVSGQKNFTEQNEYYCICCKIMNTEQMIDAERKNNEEKTKTNNTKEIEFKESESKPTEANSTIEDITEE